MIDTAALQRLALAVARAPTADDVVECTVTGLRAVRGVRRAALHVVGSGQDDPDDRRTPPHDAGTTFVGVLVHEGVRLGALVVVAAYELADGERDALQVLSAHVAIALHGARIRAALRADVARLQEEARRDGAVGDATDRERAARALRRSRRRTIEARFVAKLAERTRLAREIHDTLLQGVTGLTLRLRAAVRDLRGEPAIAATLEEIIALAERTMQDARHAVWELRAPALERGALAAAIRAAADAAVAGTGLQLRCDVTGLARAVEPAIEEVVLRVVQEAVVNVVRHAAATSVSIRLTFGERRLRVAVIDDGRGIADPGAPPPEGHWGLVGVRERAAQVRGRVTLRSAPGAGTELALVVPYGPARGPHRASGATAT